MYKIRTMNKISEAGLNCLGNNYQISDDFEDAIGIILRSKALHDMEFPKELLVIARAGAGVNNIPLKRCSEEGIVVFNAPGANANAVKELVIASMIMGARNATNAVSWCKTLEGDISPQVEKGKSNFKGSEIAGKTLGVIGLGHIGRLVANTALDLGMNVKGYDPYININGAVSLKPGIEVIASPENMLPDCDFVTVHMPVTQSTAGSINMNLFRYMKSGSVLMNFSRDKLVNEADLISAMDKGIIEKYITDFPTIGLYRREDVITTPHLGASTIQAEENCARMAALEMKEYIETGNIKNSVNFPTVDLGPFTGAARVAIITKGEPDPLKLALAMFADKNIKSIAGGTNGEYGYALLETNDEITRVPKVDGVIRVRVLQDM